MPDEPERKIIIDSDWKAEAEREKEKLAAEAEREKSAKAEGAPEESLFLELLDLLAQQAVITLGGAQTGDGRTIPPNPMLAKHFIDMLGMIEEKTKGNLTKEEAETLNTLLSRLRWAFSMSVAPAPPGGGQAGPRPGTPNPKS